MDGVNAASDKPPEEKAPVCAYPGCQCPDHDPHYTGSGPMRQVEQDGKPLTICAACLYGCWCKDIYGC